MLFPPRDSLPFQNTTVIWKTSWVWQLPLQSSHATSLGCIRFYFQPNEPKWLKPQKNDKNSDVIKILYHCKRRSWINLFQRLDVTGWSYTRCRNINQAWHKFESQSLGFVTSYRISYNDRILAYRTDFLPSFVIIISGLLSNRDNPLIFEPHQCLCVLVHAHKHTHYSIFLEFDLHQHHSCTLLQDHCFLSWPYHVICYTAEFCFKSNRLSGYTVHYNFLFTGWSGPF